MKTTTKNSLLIIVLLVLPVVVAFADDNQPKPWAANLGQILINLQNNLPSVVQLVVAISYVLGVAFVFSGVHELRVYGQMRTMMAADMSVTGPLGRVAIGALLIYLPGFINVSVYTLWDQSVYNVQAYFQPGSEAYANQLFDAVIALVRVFGYISILHGLIILSRVAKRGAQPGSFGKGMIHVIGGVLGVNIVGTIQVIMATFFQT